MLLQIGDGTNWLDLTPAGMDLVDIERIAARGNEDVTERATFNAETSGGLAETAIAGFQQWVELARARRLNIARPRVYIRQKHANDSVYWRAEVYDGYAATDTTTRQAYGGRSRFTVGWTREATLYSETEATLAGPVTVYNTYAGGNSNILALGQNTAAGLTPVRLAITNNNAASLGMIWAGLYRSRSAIVAASLGAVSTLEAEAGTVLAGVGTNTASGSASGGNYRAFSWSGTTETALLSWALSAANLGYLSGRNWRAFARVTAAPGNVSRLRLSLKYGTVTLAATELAPVSGSAILEMPALAIPPYDPAGATYAALTLELAALGTGTNTLNLDCLHLLPTDSYRYYAAGAGGELATSEILGDNPNAGTVLAAAAGAVRGTIYAGGAPLQVGVNDYASVVFLQRDSTGAAAIGLNMAVTAYAAPRRRTAI